ncbi:MAG: hypothetical protein KGZ35_00750 [Truepera sp.]|nr:hypothetical protein [Truepera sp.]
MGEVGNFLAVDLGASGGRVLQGRFDGARFRLAELHRFGAPGGVTFFAMPAGRRGVRSCRVSAETPKALIYGPLPH